MRTLFMSKSLWALFLLLLSCQDPNRSKTYSESDPDVKTVHATVMDRNKSDQGVKDLIEMVYGSAGFSKLTKEEKVTFLRVLSGKNPISVEARKRLAASAYKGDDASKQYNFIQALKIPTYHLLPISNTKISKASIGPATSSRAWVKGNGYKETPADRYMVTLTYADGAKVDVPTDFQSGVDHTGWITPQELADAMTVLPFEMAATTPSIRVSDFTGANASTGPKDGVIDYGAKNSPHPPRTISHEIGHTVTYLLFRDKNGWTQEKQMAATTEDGGFLPSGYANTSTFELVGEMGVVYVEAYMSPYKYEYREIYPKQLKMFEDAFIKAYGSRYKPFVGTLAEESKTVVETKPTENKTVEQKPNAPSGNAQAAGSSYFPKCTKAGYTSSSFNLTYMSNTSGWGYMKSSKAAFSCKEKAEGSTDDKFPVCEVACKGKSGTIKNGWGWCQNTDGFSCKE